MSDRIKVVTPNGGSEIEIDKSELKRFTDQGFTVAAKTPAARTSTKSKSEVKNGDV